MYDDVTLLYDVTTCRMMWHYVGPMVRTSVVKPFYFSEFCLFLKIRCDTPTVRWTWGQCVWWCDTMYDDVTLCMMMWHSHSSVDLVTVSFGLGYLNATDLKQTLLHIRRVLKPKGKKSPCASMCVCVCVGVWVRAGVRVRACVRVYVCMLTLL